MIRNIVFDVGDVLVDFRWRAYMKDLGFSDALTEELGQKMVMSEFWHEMDLGRWEEEDAQKYFIEKMPEYKTEITLFWQNIADIVKPFPYSDPMIRSLKKQGYGVYLLSNYPAHLAEVHWKTFGFLNAVDGYIISGREHLTKPDARIYRLLPERFGIRLSESVFVDDREKNVEGAVQTGMEGILFQGYGKLKEAFRKKGIIL